MFSWLGSKKKKEKKTMIESTIEQDSVYQWIKGDRTGEMVKFKEISEDETGDQFVNFTDGTRIRSSLFQEYLIHSEVEIDNDEIFGRNLPSTTDRRLQVGNVSVGNVVSVVSKKSNSPIRVLLEKQKPNWVKINIELEINIPTKDLYEILSNSFDDAEKEIIDFCTEELEMEDIKKALGETLKKIYTSKKSRGNE
jgi:hypothetical protein